MCISMCDKTATNQNRDNVNTLHTSNQTTDIFRVVGRQLLISFMMLRLL